MLPNERSNGTIELFFFFCCMINFQTSPEQYEHWKLSFDDAVATLSMDVQEDQTLAEGYKLKLNSYDLGVDIELADAIQRLRFEQG